MRVENKRHTNAHQPLTSHSPTEASIPPLRQNSQANGFAHADSHTFFINYFGADKLDAHARCVQFRTRVPAEITAKFRRKSSAIALRSVGTLF